MSTRTCSPTPRCAASPRRLSLALIAVVAGIASCARSVESPYDGDGRIGVDGVIAMATLDVETLRRFLPEDRRHLPPVGLRTHAFLLDPSSYGAPCAVVFSGVRPDLAVGWLEAAEQLNEISAGEYELAPGVIPSLPPLARRQLAFGGRSGQEVRFKRFDGDDRALLTPSVDLRETLLSLAKDVDRVTGPATSFAVAVDGPSYASFMRREIMPHLRRASGVVDMLRESAPERALNAAEAFAAAVEVQQVLVDGLLGLVVQRNESTLDLRIEMQPDSALQRSASALRPLKGELPVAAGERAIEAMLSLDPQSLVGELRRATGATVRLDALLGWCGSWSGRMTLSQVDDEWCFAMELADGADQTEFERAGRLIGLTGRVDRGFWITGDFDVEWRAVDEVAGEFARFRGSQMQGTAAVRGTTLSVNMAH